MKNIAFPIIALLLVVSVLTPSLLPLLDKDSDIVLLTDTNEEEKQSEKETEKKVDEKDLYFNKIHLTNTGLLQIPKQYQLEYVWHSSDFVVDILLPPPRTV